MVKRIKESMKKTTVDKWKKKQWYKVYATKDFDTKEIGETVATKPESIAGRTIEISVRELLNQIKKHYIKVKFSIVDVKGKKAYTETTGHYINEGFLRKFVRRRSSKIELVASEKSKDGVEVKIKAVAVSGRKADAQKRTDVRKIMEKELKEFIISTNSEDIVSQIIAEKPIKNMLEQSNKIVPIKRIELLKSEIRRAKQKQ